MSDRYKFLKDYNDPKNPAKTFKSGWVARLDDATGAALVADGTVMQVGDFTPQRKNPLAPGGCTVLSPEAKEILNGGTTEVKGNKVVTNKKS